jgi:5-(carboxyamino)imidazole ribonucleotide synthase
MMLIIKLAKIFLAQCVEWYLRRFRVSNMKAGILGGGQLGRMLLQAAANYPVETYVMEDDKSCPAANLCHHFVTGDIQNFDAVYNFGKNLDVLTIEIEAVNVDALAQLESEGVKVFPNSGAIKIIGNKILQKEFYKANQIPSPQFVVTDNLAQLIGQEAFLPAVHKIAQGGYDGRGVQLMRTAADFEKGFDAPSVLEKMVTVKKEIAVMVAMNAKGETTIYPPSEMFFDPVLNLLDFQVSPAQIPQNALWKAEAIALRTVKELKSPGVFAVEMFLDKNDEVWVNETAPRVHNSGHHTIEGNFSSQFDMLWRIILDYPLGNTDPILSAALVNIVGAEKFSGKAVYKGIQDVLKLDNVFVHLYGKRETKPGRKMGHVTILSNERQELIHTALKVKKMLRVESEVSGLSNGVF